MKKNVIIAAIAATLVSLCLITACNKENSAANEEYAPAMKFSVDQMLQQRVRTIWYLTDFALRTNPEKVMAVADEEDFGKFMEITGIPETLMCEIFGLAEERFSQGGEVDSTYPGCYDCDMHALSNFINNCVDLRSILDNIHQYDPNFVDSTIIKIPNGITQCEYECRLRYVYYHKNRSKFILCLIDCHMQHSIEDAIRHLEVLSPKVD